MKNGRMMQGRSLAALLAAFGALSAQAGPRVPMPQLKGQDALDYAATALGKVYVWGGTTWDSTAATRGKGNGPDCSGLVLKAWRFPKELKSNEPLPIKTKWDIGGVLVQPRQDTRTMYAGEFEGVDLPWTATKDYSKAVKGDALVWKGHTMLVWERNAKTGSIKTIEAIGSSYDKTVHLVRTTSFLEAKSTKLLRRDNLAEAGALKAVKIAAPKSTSKPAAKPSPKPTSTPTASEANTVRKAETVTFHTVAKGDTVFGLALKYQVSVGHITRLNPGLNVAKIQVGQKIRVK